MEYKWLGELTEAEMGRYDPNKIIIWYDRIYDEYCTLDGGRLDKFLSPIKEPKTKE